MPVELVVQTELAMPVSCRQLQAGLVAVLAAADPQGTDALRILTVRVTDDREIRTLNRTFRGLDEATDVLSFGGEADSPADDLVVPAGLPGVLGDLVLSRPYIERAAARLETAAADEFMLCFVHGVLHLLGFDHATAAAAECMFPLQDRIVRELGYRPRRTWLPDADRPDA